MWEGRLSANSRGEATAGIIIQGLTRAGRAFRPGDRAERLCGVLSTFGGDQQMRYSPYVRPMLMDEVRCAYVMAQLRAIELRAYRLLLDFANDNELVVIDPTRPEGSAEYCPAPGVSIGPGGGTPPETKA